MWQKQITHCEKTAVWNLTNGAIKFMYWAIHNDLHINLICNIKIDVHMGEGGSHILVDKVNGCKLYWESVLRIVNSI